MKNNIIGAIQRQFQRYGAGHYNASLSSTEITQKLRIHPQARQLLNEAAKHYALSIRSYFKTIKVAQTIADLEGVTEVGIEHISEALSFRENQIEH